MEEQNQNIEEMKQNAEAENQQIEEMNQNAEEQNQQIEEMKQNAEVENQNIEEMKQNAEMQNQTAEERKQNVEAQVKRAETKKNIKSEKSDKNDKEKTAVLEAILFAMGDSVEVSRLAQVIGETPKKTRNLLLELQKKYKRDKRGIDLIELDDCFQMCTRPEMYEYLVKIAKVPRKYTLSDTVLETLSIVAYKQPVTRIEIEKIRGVSCDHAINRLLEFDLIKEVGRLDAPGRPLLFGTTEQFLRSFGVKSLEELPQLNPDRVEEFREEAEQEVQLKLDI